MCSLKNFFMAVLLTFALAFCSIAEAGIVTDRFPFWCYVDHQVDTYEQPNGRRVGYISAEVDLVRVTNFRSDGWFYGDYPISGGRRIERWFKISDVCADFGYSNRGTNVRGAQRVFRTKNSGETIGSVSNNESVIVLADNGNRAQILYRLDNGTGYKIGWVPSSSVAANQPVGANFQLSNYNLSCPSDHQLRFTGRVWNANDNSEITGVHVYIGGGVGAGGEFMGEFRSDSNHNFDKTLNVPQHRNGNQLIVIYAVNGKDAGELNRTNINVSGGSTPSNDYDSKVRSFINDDRFKHGATWSAGKTPTISGAGTGWGCNAYARDFVKYVFDTNLKGNGSTQFYNINEIKAGDVIYVSPSDHWIVVLYRNGDNLTTAEGNWEGKVVVGDIYYKIQNGNIYHRNRSNQNYSYFRPFQYGYHHR